MVMGIVYTRIAWNSIIDQINDKIKSCGSSITPLVEVDPDHVWTTDDVTPVRDTLTKLCASSNPVFIAPLTIWAQAIIDEINKAIANCQCTECDLAADAGITINVTVPASVTSLGWRYGGYQWAEWIDFTSLIGLTVGAAKMTYRALIGTATPRSAILGDFRFEPFGVTWLINCDGTLYVPSGYTPMRNGTLVTGYDETPPAMPSYNVVATITHNYVGKTKCVPSC